MLTPRESHNLLTMYEGNALASDTRDFPRVFKTRTGSMRLLVIYLGNYAWRYERDGLQIDKAEAIKLVQFLGEAVSR